MEGSSWIAGGDFNIYLNDQERSGGAANGTHNKTGEMLDFAEVINDCNLIDPRSVRLRFTWARGDLFERLDRILINEGWASNVATTRVTVLPRVASDHGPLLVRCSESDTRPHAPFRFQHMWIRHHLFLEEVKKLWSVETEAQGMRKLHIKLGNVKKGLKSWNKEVFGNIFVRLRNKEAMAVEAKQSFEAEPTTANKETHNRRTAEYLLCLRIEEEYWRQKAAIRWVVEGERTTKFYQGWVRQKRVKAKIHEINVEGRLISNEEELRQSAVDFYQNLFSSDIAELEEPQLDLIQGIPNELNAGDLCKTPNCEEVKQAVFGI
ncbi:uncharacterized protein LOC121770421 [Salvia splendens]|uniref:uncharacterized protein LOC121770421 n=1 Tax=Salvia splendens TaxID=180675 RepID=UPI001C265CD9|nr:uncharacterized protein LOC121770421 [Salvia splendens]